MSSLELFSGDPILKASGKVSPMASALASVIPRYTENCRPMAVDPCTGQSVCCAPSESSCGPVAMLHPSTAPPHGLTAMYPQLPTHFAADSVPMFYPQSMMAGGGVCYPYDHIASTPYPYYGESYGAMDLNGARRKNATRETTSTLKAWLYEHRKNPYPTKGEKIMLAIITKMTLTQVSTWFANARRRLKKENKMTWSPRNRCEDDDDEDEDDEDESGKRREDYEDNNDDGLGTDLESNHNETVSDIDEKQDISPGQESPNEYNRIINVSPCWEPRVPPPPSHIVTNCVRDSVNESNSRDLHCDPSGSYCPTTSPTVPLPPSVSVIRPTCRPISRTPPPTNNPANKPKIWSLVDVALSKSPERPQRPVVAMNSSHHRYQPYMNATLPSANTLTRSTGNGQPGLSVLKPQRCSEGEAVNSRPPYSQRSPPYSPQTDSQRTVVPFGIPTARLAAFSSGLSAYYEALTSQRIQQEKAAGVVNSS